MLFKVHARHSVEEVSLQPQGKGGPGRLLDRVACLRNIDVLDRPAVYPPVGRLNAESGNQPVRLPSVSSGRRVWAGLQQHTRPSRRHTEGSRELNADVSDALSEKRPSEVQLTLMRIKHRRDGCTCPQSVNFNTGVWLDDDILFPCCSTLVGTTCDAIWPG